MSSANPFNSISSNNGSSTFWMPPEKHFVKDLGAHPSRLAAIIVENILYDGFFFLSDTKSLSDLYIASTGSHVIYKLIDAKFICIARRVKDDKVVNLADINKSDPKERLKTWNLDPNQASNYLDFLDKVDERTRQDKLLFSTAEASNYFSSKVLELLQADYGEQFPNELANEIYELSKEKLETDGNLTQSFFVKGGIGDLVRERDPVMWSHLYSANWEQYQNFINNLANAAYSTFLPNHFSANPVYAPEHQKPFEIWRGFAEVKRELVGESLKIKSPYDIAGYVRGLNALTFEDIVFLLETDERAHFLNVLDSIHEPNTSQRDVWSALVSYRRRICEQIATHFGVDAESPTDLIVNSYVAEGKKRAFTFFIKEAALAAADVVLFNVPSKIEKMWTIYEQRAISEGKDERSKQLKDAVEKTMSLSADLDEARRILDEQERDEPLGRIERELRPVSTSARDTIVT